MEIKSSLISRHTGNKVHIHYIESDPLEDLGDKILEGVHAFCFYEDKMVLVNHPESGWMPPGGRIEEGETYEEAVIREIQEETNMEVVRHELIGFQDSYDSERGNKTNKVFL